MYRQPNEKFVEDDIMKLLKVVFLTTVYNDPLVRLSLKSYLKSAPLEGPAGSLPSETYQTYKRLQDIETDWTSCLQSPRITEFFSFMSDINVYQNYSNFEGYCKTDKGKCNHEGRACIEWTKSLWQEIMNMHIRQVCEFHEQSSKAGGGSDECANLSDEMFGVKAYIRST